MRELAIDVDESISKLPFEEVEKMVNDDNLKKCLLFVNGIAALLNGRWKYCEDNLLNEEYKDKLENDRVAVEKFIEENPLLQERVPWFVEMLYNYFVVIEKAYNCSTKEELRSFFNSREYIANSRLSIKRKVWLAYNDLLQPLIKLVFDQRDLPEAAKKYFAEYVAQC
ncbi:hypothetical protein J6T66_01900 [bacterium]|nr:hypothetical protein [bacterium]